MAGRISIWLVCLIALEGRAAEGPRAPSLSWEGRTAVGIGIGLSEETADAPVSIFGHLFAYVLTVGPDGKPWPRDLETAVNVAVTEGGNPTEASYHLMPLHRVLHAAMTQEGRSVVMLELQLDPAELGLLLDELRNRQDVRARYDLIRRNCSFYILDWLATARPALAPETRWRPVWTPRQAAELIESNFRVTRRERLTATASWAKASTQTDGTTVRTLLPDAEWCRHNEGFLIGAGVVRSGDVVSGGFTLGFGQRGFESSPSPVSGPTSLKLLEVSHHGALPDGTTRVDIIDFDNLREFSGEQGRLSQRLAIGWHGLSDPDGLSDWIMRYETGMATEVIAGAWISLGGGFALCEGGPGPARPSASASLLCLGEATSLHVRYTTTGGQHQGLETAATLRLSRRSQLKATWSDGPRAPSTLGLGLETRF